MFGDIQGTVFKKNKSLCKARWVTDSLQWACFVARDLGALVKIDDMT